MRRYYIKSINSIVPFKKFIHLDTATKIAIVNANYRGEFPSTLKKKFNTAVVNGQWASAVAVYLDHPDFKNNKCYTTGRGSICTRMKWNAEQFMKHVNKQGCIKVLMSLVQCHALVNSKFISINFHCSESFKTRELFNSVSSKRWEVRANVDEIEPYIHFLL